MNRHLLLWLIAMVLLATTGCPPRHPPHTPQPFGKKHTSSGLSSPDCAEERFDGGTATRANV